MKFPSLSIITINKNNAAGLKKTCLSVITQTFNDFEWIIIDGASEDNSVNIIKQYSGRVTYWKSEPDSGIYNAINKGVRKAKGEYCLFLNSGDFLLHPWTLEELFNEIKSYKQADVFFSDCVWDTYSYVKFPKNITLYFFIKNTYSISHQNALIRRELFNHQLYNEKYKIISDWYFFITELIQHNISFFHIRTNITVYDSHGISSTNKKKCLIERKMALKELKISRKIFNMLFLFEKILILTKYLIPYGFYKLYIYFKKILFEKDTVDSNYGKRQTL